jgi:hypothetical protein
MGHVQHKARAQPETACTTSLICTDPVAVAFLTWQRTSLLIPATATECRHNIMKGLFMHSMLDCPACYQAYQCFLIFARRFFSTLEQHTLGSGGCSTAVHMSWTNIVCFWIPSRATSDCTQPNVLVITLSSFTVTR